MHFEAIFQIQVQKTGACINYAQRFWLFFLKQILFKAMIVFLAILTFTCVTSLTHVNDFFGDEEYRRDPSFSSKKVIQGETDVDDVMVQVHRISENSSQFNSLSTYPIDREPYQKWRRLNFNH